MTVRLGIIGAGGIGTQHAGAAARAGSTVAAICDVDATRAATLAADHPEAATLTSVDELLARDDVPAVVIAVPNHLHCELAVRALAAGKDVLLEKPMAIDVDECDEIIAAAAAGDRLVQLGFVSRFAPAAQAVRRLVDDGALGRIYLARAQWYRRRGIPGLGGWFTTRARSGGGVLIDLGVHLVDLVLHFTGRPAVRRASGVCTSTFGKSIEGYRFHDMWSGPPRPGGVFDVEDAASGLLRCDGGLTVELTTTWAANVPEDLMPSGILLLGDKAGCFLDVWGNRVVLAREESGSLVDAEPQLEPGDAWSLAWEREHAAFAASVTTRTPPEPSLAHGREVQVILDALYRSSAAGRELEIREGTEGRRD